MYKILLLSVMFIFSFAKDSGASGSPWDPRAGKGDGMSEGTKDDQLPLGHTEESSPPHAEESEE